VHVTATLTAGQWRRLSAALSQVYGHEVYLNVVLDRRVVGGMTGRVGDELARPLSVPAQP
jgi:F-type H+-transporting ATPase subunit delta